MCPPSLRCCVRLAGFVSGLVSQLVSHLVWDAVSASLVLSFSCLRSCLRSCLPSWLGCRVRLAGLSPVLSPSLSPIWSGMLCPPPWSCLSLVSGLVSQLLSLFCLVACLSSGMLCLPPLGLSFSCLWSCLPSLSPIWFGMLRPPRWPCLSLVCGLVSGLVCHLGWDAVSASLGCLRSCLPACLPSGLGCCVCLAGLVFLLSAVLSPVLSAILAGMPCPPRWAVSGLVSQLVSHLVWDALSAFLVLSFSCLWSCLPAFVFVLSRSLSFIWDAVSAPPGLVFFPKEFIVGVLNAVLSVSALAGALCPPRWACLPICLPSGFVFHLGWGAVSASLSMSPNLSPIWLCLSAWLGCCVCAGVLCPPRWSCLPICIASGFVFHLGWGAVSASLGLSPNLSHLALSFTGVLCPPRWACLPICLPVFFPHLFPIWLCLSPWLGCCVRLAGLVSQFVSSGFVFHWGAVSASLGLSPNLSPSVLSPFVSHLALSFTLAGVLRPPRWACLRSCLPICFARGFVFYVGWGVVSASLGVSPNLSPTCLCLSPWLGCCVRLAGLVS